MLLDLIGNLKKDPKHFGVHFWDIIEINYDFSKALTYGVVDFQIYALILMYMD
jgi:hypothetical protein